MEEHRVALVTGSASGIGEATVRYFAERKVKVLAVDVSGPKGRAVVRELGPNADSVVFCECDVRDEAATEAAVRKAYEAFGRLDAVCNVAGILVEKPLHETSVDEWNLVHDVNLRGPFFVTKHAVLQWLQCGSTGAIVNIASIAGIQADPSAGAYSVSKHGVVGLTRVTAATYGPHGIRCNAISPGSVLTPILEQWFEGMGGGADLRGRLERLYPSRRLFQPIEIAQVAFFLISDAASAINGANIPADGGLTATVMETALASFA